MTDKSKLNATSCEIIQQNFLERGYRNTERNLTNKRHGGKCKTGSSCIANRRSYLGWDSLVYIKKKINKMKQFGAISAFIELFSTTECLGSR